ncbi:MAG: hypothetical protein KF830_15875 [Planctomycetes bacterium]|nr:hypothetical protein [Planctomycetota bacterium]
MATDVPRRRIRFAAGDLPEQLAAFAARWPDAVAGAGGDAFVAPGGIARLRLPFVVAAAVAGEPASAYAARAAAGPEPGLQVVLLLRAGAMALGGWLDGELIAHKAMRKYVVRGQGHAQPTHRRTKGKSRYGARLRLQNWRRLLTATSERLHELWQQSGPPRRVFWSAPVRVWVDLLAAAPPPPFGRDDPALRRLPLHVHRPDFAELQRVRGWLEHGELELPA